MIHLDQPWWLMGLLLLPLLALGLKIKPPTLRFPSAALFQGFSHTNNSRALLILLRALALALLLIALSRPQWGRISETQSSRGIDVMLVVDVSGSMEAMDFQLQGKPTNRLTAVKNMMVQFIQDRTDDRIGIVAFAGRPYLVSPLTLDHDWLLLQMDRIVMGFVEDGTAIGSAIVSGVNRLTRQESQAKRVMILLTDGVNNAGAVDPLVAAQTASALNVKVYTIGVGTRGKAPMPATNMWGQRAMVMVDVEIDEEMLQKISQITGGSYFRATDTDSLRRIYQEINQMEKVEHRAKKFFATREFFPWFIAMSLACILLELILSHTLWRRLP